MSTELAAYFIAKFPDFSSARTTQEQLAWLDRFASLVDALVNGKSSPNRLASTL